MRKYLILFLLLTVAASRAGAYERIISLAPSVTKSLYLLGLENKVIGVTMYCPMGTTKKEIIGNVLEPNIEKIALLKPGLVIVSKEGNRQQTAAQLQNAGMKVYIMDSVGSFDNICGEFIKLGRFLGVDKKASAVVSDARKKIAGVRAKIKGRKPLTVFWEIGAQPLFTVSEGSFVNDFTKFAGGVNIFEKSRSRYPQVSMEEVVSRDPDVILIVTMGDVTEKERTAWLGYRAMKAAKTGRIYVLNDATFTDPTPAAIADGAEKVEALLFP
jgi:iron complex transport system substrate-binding protein